MTTTEEPATAPPPRGFPVGEYERRTARAQRLMTAAGFDALLFTTEPNVRYFSGFHTRFWESPTRPWFLVVPREGRPIAVFPSIGAAAVAGTWIEDVRTWPAPRPEDDGVSLLAATLRETVGRFGRLGATFGPETHLRMPLADFERLRDLLRPHEFADATPIIRELRRIKSPAEIEKIRFVARLASDAFEALPERIRRGDSERTICRAFRRDLLARGADDTPYVAAASGPEGYDNIIMGPGDRVPAEGDVMIIDTGATFDGYFCDFDRNFAFGRPSDRVRRAYGTVYEATRVGLEAARPGATAAEVWARMWRVLEAGGALASDVGRLGHGLGMQLTEGFSVMEGDGTRLEPGMVMTIEPGMTFAPGRLMVHEENIVITEDGAELLSRRAPPELPVVA